MTGLAAYLPTLRNGFLYDDDPYIVANPQVDGLAHVAEIFVSSFPPDKPEQGLFRPLTTFSFALDDAVWGKDHPGGFHLTGALLHVAASVLLTALASLLLPPLGALFAGLLYATHPVLTEAVAGAANRSTVLAAVFALATILLARRRSAAAFALALACFLAGLLSKEDAVVIPVLLLLVETTLDRKLPGPRRLVTRYGPFAVVAALYVGLRVHVLGELGPTGLDRHFHGAPPAEQIATMARVFAHYLELAVWPHPLRAIYDMRHSPGFGDPRAVVAALVVLGVLGAGILAWRRRTVTGLGVLWFFVALLPVSNLYPIGELIAERFLYLPVMGAALVAGAAVAGAARRGPRGRAAAIVVASLVVVTFLGLTVRRNETWRDRLTLWEETVRTAPRSGKAHYNLARALESLGDPDRAEHEYRLSIEVEPGMSAHPRYNLGTLLMERGRPAEAVAVLEAAAREFPADAGVRNNLGLALGKTGRLVEAREQYTKAVELDPDYALAHNNLAVVCFILRDYECAIRHADLAADRGFPVNPAFLSDLAPFRSR